MTMRPQLLLPVEVATRELKAKTLLALEAAKRGWRVFLGEPGAVQVLAEHVAPSAYLEKNINPRRQALFERLSARGHALVAWDEEGLAVLDYDWYVTKNIKPEMLRRVRHFLCWGEDERNAIARRFPSEAGRLVITGNPRGDLLRPEWRTLLEEDGERYRASFGDYILIVSSFSRVNRFLGGEREDFVRTIQDSFALSDDKLDFLRGSLAHFEVVFEGFKALLPQLARAFPDRTIVLRPHPAERSEVWHELARPHPNVKVVFEGEATGWIAGAGAMIHNGCTTAVEAFALGRLPLCYRPVVSDAFDVELPNALSVTADDIARLFDLVRDMRGFDRQEAGSPEYVARLPRLERAVANARGAPATTRTLDLLAGLNVQSAAAPPSFEAYLEARGARARRWARRKAVVTAKLAVKELLGGRLPGRSVAAYASQKLTGFDAGAIASIVERFAAHRADFARTHVTAIEPRLAMLEAQGP